MWWFSNLFGWHKTKAAIAQMEVELTPAMMKASLPLLAKPATKKHPQRPRAWVGVWSWSLQEWVTIHGTLPAGLDEPCVSSNGIAEFYAAPSQR